MLIFGGDNMFKYSNMSFSLKQYAHSCGSSADSTVLLKLQLNGFSGDCSVSPQIAWYF